MRLAVGSVHVAQLRKRSQRVNFDISSEQRELLTKARLSQLADFDGNIEVASIDLAGVTPRARLLLNSLAYRLIYQSSSFSGNVVTSRGRDDFELVFRQQEDDALL